MRIIGVMNMWVMPILTLPFILQQMQQIDEEPGVQMVYEVRGDEKMNIGILFDNL
jgi:hypothetical protein